MQIEVSNQKNVIIIHSMEQNTGPGNIRIRIEASVIIKIVIRGSIISVI